ncbi:MAG: hypothetical protein HN576_17590 [Bacteriovoracaceae bacterium]|jgi:hypothetical protein|nr:hypothetical protein [Bacteriovoracaceae bacterium]
MSKKMKKYIPKTKDEVLNELKQRDKFNLLVVKSKDKAPTQRWKKYRGALMSSIPRTV